MEATPPTINERGDEEHPSFGVVRLSRVSAQPGVRLFDSSIPHHEFVHLEISRAGRHRDLMRDQIFTSRSPLVEVEMSLTQWGALVSSFNQGAGTPVTLHRVAGEDMPQALHESRLAETAREVKDAASKSTEEVRAAVQAVVDAFENKAGRRELAALIRTLTHTAGNLPSNMKFAADTLTRHAEDVVAKARADIEASQQLGGSAIGGAPPLLELEGGSV